MRTDRPARSAGSHLLARVPRPTPEDVASALASGFLGAARWDKPALVAAGAEVLGARRRWLGPLAAALLELYPRAPADSARQLATSITLQTSFSAAVDAAARRFAFIPLAHHPAVAASARPTTPALPTLHGLSDLAELLEVTVGELQWFADTALWNRRAGPGRLHHYRYEWRLRPGRAPRLLEIPGKRLRALQRTVLTSILRPLPVHNAAHGFIPGRSAITGAAEHTGRRAVIALDLSTFFSTVTPARIYGALRQAGLPEAVAHTLTGLCTHAVPPWVLTAMPAGGDAAERFALRRALAAPHLPQGAPTSPTLANLSVRRLDARLSGFAAAAGATYTRYADDLAFSGDAPFAARADAFIRAAGRIVTEEGHRLNAAKTRVRPAGTRQQVTGIVVNQHTNATRRDYDALKAILHNCVTAGPATQNRANLPDFRAHLRGRIGWVESLNPDRGRRLREQFERISW